MLLPTLIWTSVNSRFSDPDIYLIFNVPFYRIAYTGCLQMNGAVSKVNKKFISHLTRAQRTPSVAATVQVPHALPAVQREFRARNSRCTVITDLDTSKRSTQKAFSCCDAILETGPAAKQ